MLDDDPVDDLRSLGMMAGTSISRATEVLMRAAQDAQAEKQRALRAGIDEAADRHAAHAELAERQFVRARRDGWLDRAEPREAAATWGASVRWAEVDPERFGEHRDAISTLFKDRHNLDLPELAERLGSREFAMDLAEMAVRRGRELEEELALKQLTWEQSARLEREAANVEAAAAAEHLTPPERENLERRADSLREEANELSRRGLITVEEVERVQRNADAAAGREEAPASLGATGGHGGSTSAAGAQTASYDSPERREATVRAMRGAGVPDAVVHARATADHLNGRDPRESATKKPAGSKTAGRGISAGRTRDMGRSR